MKAVIAFFHASSAVSFYGDLIKANIILIGMGVGVFGVTTSKQYDLAIKMRRNLRSSEGDMADFAAQNTDRVLTGRVYGSHHILVDKADNWKTMIMVGDRVPGETVKTVWERLNGRELRSFKKDLTAQLAAHMARMRALKQPFIGRVGHNGQGPAQETRKFYDGPFGGYFGPFTGPDPEAEFDEWGLSQLPDPNDQAKWRKRLEKDRQKRGSPRSSVLTHADLTVNNIMVAKDSTSGKYTITGIIDWDRSGFFPDYLEYAVLKKISFHDKAWLKILKSAVPPGDCSRDRLAFTHLVQRACNPTVMW
ncbi:hypothetical protein C8A00DRAFT_14204 [Chaetomidium leptoderma]|uniref:Aminoglycoside phosphotransferase domain-containing protein n=1 Tax=Chaetomidium leptoderma TaxID=669021 RepID=A0AAN6ZYC7_9PEZI|nr:hypothetical protein C8A00DRAFT_14204 [Chaetomidium leptoderma]